MAARIHRFRDKCQTRPLVRESAPHRQNRNCLTVTQIWSWAPEGASHQDIGRLTVRHNVTLTDLTLT
jgi:hypothetical protein